MHKLSPGKITLLSGLVESIHIFGRNNSDLRVLPTSLRGYDKDPTDYFKDILYHKRGKYCLIASPRGQSCKIIARFCRKLSPPRARYVILSGHAQDTDNYIFRDDFGSGADQPKNMVAFLKMSSSSGICNLLLRREYSKYCFS